jgi:hypothetical protein
MMFDGQKAKDVNFIADSSKANVTAVIVPLRTVFLHPIGLLVTLFFQFP